MERARDEDLGKWDGVIFFTPPSANSNIAMYTQDKPICVIITKY